MDRYFIVFFEVSVNDKRISGSCREATFGTYVNRESLEKEIRSQCFEKEPALRDGYKVNVVVTGVNEVSKEDCDSFFKKQD